MRPPKEEENKSQKDYRACREGTSGNMVPAWSPFPTFFHCLNLGNGLGGGRAGEGRCAGEGGYKPSRNRHRCCWEIIGVLSLAGRSIISFSVSSPWLAFFIQTALSPVTSPCSAERRPLCASPCLDRETEITAGFCLLHEAPERILGVISEPKLETSTSEKNSPTSMKEAFLQRYLPARLAPLPERVLGKSLYPSLSQ